MSEYLSDQGKRTQLLDLVASMHEGLVDLSTELLAMHHGGINEDEWEARSYRACTLAMDIQADWGMIEPMLADMWGNKATVPNP
jgi:hypothetical protein